MFVKPAPERKVRDPKTMHHLPATGADVPEENYWLRRLSDGDVVPANAADEQPTSDEE